MAVEVAAYSRGGGGDPHRRPVWVPGESILYFSSSRKVLIDGVWLACGALLVAVDRCDGLG